ncbi:MAG: D-alanyl-D-alanine carboxypeptidase, partial [Corynebacterium sp.]|nr:D-alanyl-D-alanine carboxypeptidase [Corynebacterium sp.]
MTLPTSAHRVSTRCLAAGLTTVFATCVYAPFASAPFVGAQELTPAPEPTANVRGHYEGDDFIPEVRVSAPDTESCPQATWPAEPVTTSEAVSAGSAPTPLAVTYTGPCGVSAPAGFSVPEDVVASSWLVADIDTGDIVAMKDPHGRYRPASIIKVLLALVAIRDLPLDKEVVVSHDSAAQEGSAVGIVEGGRYTVNDLLHGLLLASGND